MCHLAVYFAYSRVEETAGAILAVYLDPLYERSAVRGLFPYECGALTVYDAVLLRKIDSRGEGHQLYIFLWSIYICVSAEFRQIRHCLKSEAVVAQVKFLQTRNIGHNHRSDVVVGKIQLHGIPHICKIALAGQLVMAQVKLLKIVIILKR